MKFVLDASAALEIALGGSAERHFAGKLEEAEETLVPELFLAEVVNAIWKAHQFGGLDLEKCEKVLDLAAELADTVVPHHGLYREAFQLSRRQKSRASYDMFYLALALQEDAVLLTLDAQLKKTAKREGVRTG